MLNQQLHGTSDVNEDIVTDHASDHSSEQRGTRSWADRAVAARSWERELEGEWARLDQRLRGSRPGELRSMWRRRVCSGTPRS